MYPVYRSMVNALAFKAINTNAVMPDPSLAVGGDDEMSNVPLLIFRDQHLPIPGATMPGISELSYEKTAKKGSGDTLSMENFVTDDFNLGSEYDFLV